MQSMQESQIAKNAAPMVKELNNAAVNKKITRAY